MSRRTRHPRQGRSFKTAIALAAAVTATAPRARALVAFPGAEGFGANSVGGRGGDVYHVTTLVNDPNHLTPGSLFYGVYSKNVPAGGRTIVFDVGGTIDLSSGGTDKSLDIKDIHNVTIAGQTAPSPITLIGNTVNITGNTAATPTHDLIVQYLVCRKGTGSGDDAIHVQGTADTHDVILDHISGSWSEDEVISVTQTARNVTVQNSIMGEALTSGHQYGSLIRPTVNSQVSYLHNFYTNNESRNPRPGTYNGMALDFEFQNNVIYNWSGRAGYIAGADSNTQFLRMNYQGNYLVDGPNTPGSTKSIAFIKESNSSGPLDVHVYQAGNKIDTTSGTTRDGVDTGWNMFGQLNNSTTMTPWAEADKQASAYAYPQANSVDSADVAYAKAIGSVGAFPWARTATDQRMINELQTYTGTSPQVTPNATEWSNILSQPMTTRPANWDTDHDGMPNAWETQHGFNPAVADNNLFAVDGYTRLEHYLQSAAAIANWNPDAGGNWSDYLNWRGTRPGSADATANFNATITAPRTVNADIPVSIGQMSFAGNQPYTIAGASPVTLDVFAGSATIDVTSGSHGITAPVTLADNTIVTSAASSGVTITNLQPAPSVTLTKNGGGGLAVNNVRAAALAINDGVVVVIPDGSAAGVSKVNSLTMPGATSQLDLTNNKLITATSVATVTGLIQSGRAGGAWTGHGIITSQPDATGGGLTSIGVATAAQVKAVAPGATATWAGQTVTGTDTLAMYTYAGDATLDGKINVDDYGRIDLNATIPGATGWYNGDFNYDGKVNVDDYGIIDFNVGIQGAPYFTGGSVTGVTGVTGVTAIPEPAGAAVLTASAAALAGPVLRRRRRRGMNGRSR